MSHKLTTQDVAVLLSIYRKNSTDSIIARDCKFTTSSPRETAARHANKLARLGLVEKQGTRMFPRFVLTADGVDEAHRRAGE